MTNDITTGSRAGPGGERVDIQKIEKAVQENDLKAVTKIMGREILMLQNEVDSLRNEIRFKNTVLALAFTVLAIAIAVARFLQC